VSGPLHPSDGGTLVEVLVVPRASRDRVVGPHDGRLKVQVTAPPVEGAANDAVIRLLARTLGVPRRAVRVVKGPSSRRKTLHVADLAPDALARALASAGIRLAAFALVVFLVGACGPAEIEVDLRLVLPADTTDLARTDNVSVTVTPDGPTVTSPVSGLDFSLDVSLEPSDTEQDVSVYLAEGDELLAWGRSVRVPLSSTPALGVFVGPPGAVAALADAPALAHPAPLLARLAGFGALVVEGGGDGWVLDHRTFSVLPAARAPFEPVAGATAALSDALGGAIVVRYDEEPALLRYDPSSDEWAVLAPAGLERLAGRTGAAVLATDDGAQAFLFGGGDATDVLSIPLVPDGDGLAIEPVAAPSLPDPRGGAVALWARGPAEGDDRAVLVGTGTPAPVVWTDAGATGPDGPWTDLGCAAFDPVAPDGPAWPVTVLCAGGVRGGAPTADGLMIRVDAGGPADVTEVPGLLPAAMGAPVVLADPATVAFYGAGALVSFPRGETAAQTVQEGLSRQTGGRSVIVATGATLLVGGADAGATPVPAWEIYTPNLP